MGTCDAAKITRGRTSAGVDASSGTGLEGGTAGSDEDAVCGVGAVCAALTAAAGDEGSGGCSTTREGEACSGEERLIRSPLGETVFKCASGTDSSGGVDALFCGVLIWDRVRKKQRRGVIYLFAAAQYIVGVVGYVDSCNV